MATSRKGTLLVVDDEEIMRDILETLLTREGYEVRLASSGEEGLDLARTVPFDAAIVDIMMPGFDGIATLDELKRIDEDLAVIIITAYGTVPAAVRAMRAGAVDVLQKPFAPKELVKRVQQAISIAERHRAADARRAALKEGVERLTPREQEVLGLSFAGKTARQIAETLNLSVRTVETHRAHILAKMGGRSPGDLADLLKGGSSGE